MTTTGPSVDLADRAHARSAGPRTALTGSTRASRTRRKWYEIIGLTAPAIAVYVMFVLVPMGYAVYYSLFRWRGVGPPTQFVGLRNYGLAFEDPIFLSALRNNLIIVVGSLLIQGPLALGIALLLNRRFRARAAFRLLVFVPFVLAEVTVGIMWRLILVHDGTADTLLRSLGLGNLVQPWLAGQDIVIWTLLFVLTWKFVGFAIILFLAGLSNVPEELSEAAAIDGASWWQIQRHVTIPLLGPDDPDLGVPVDDRRDPGVRRDLGGLGALDAIARRLGHHGHLYGRQRLLRAAVGIWQRRGRDPVFDRVHRGIAVPALRPAPRPRGRADPGGELTMAAHAVVPSGPVAHRHRTLSGSSLLTYSLALAVAAVSIAPVIYVILGGFRTTPQINADPVGLPSPWVWSTYGRVLSQGRFWTQAFNSMLISLGTTLGVVALGACAAFVLARYSFRWKEVLYTFFTLGLLFPAGAAILPLYILLRDLDLTNSYYGVILPQVAFQLPVTVVILRPFLMAIPGELEDAAMIDGTSRLGFFWRVALPLSRPALVTVGVLAFVGSWNAFLLPLLVLSDAGLHTLPLGVQNFSSQYTSDTAGILAFTSLAMLPALLFFTLAERQIVAGLQGAVKG